MRSSQASGQDLEWATGGAVTRSYISSLRNGRIENPGHTKLEAIAEVMVFPPALWAGDEEGQVPDAALAVSLEDETVREILGELLRMETKERRLLLGIARQISAPPDMG